MKKNKLYLPNYYRKLWSNCKFVKIIIFLLKNVDKKNKIGDFILRIQLNLILFEIYVLILIMKDIETRLKKAQRERKH